MPANLPVIDAPWRTNAILGAQTSISQRRPRILSWLGYIMFLFIAEEIYYALDFSLDTHLICSGLLACLFFSWQGLHDLRKRKTLHPLQIYLFGSLLHVGVGGAYAGVIIASGYAERLRTFGHLPLSFMPDALFLMQIATSCVVLGIELHILQMKNRNKSFPVSVSDFPPDHIFWLLAVVGWFMKALIISGSSSFGVLGYSLSLCPLAAVFAFTLAAVIKQNKTRYIIFVTLIVAVEFWLSRSSAMRETYAFAFLPMLLAIAIGITHSKTLADNRRESDIVEDKNQNVGGRLSHKYLGYLYAISIVAILFVGLVVFPAASMVKQGESVYIDEAMIETVTNLQQDVSKVHSFPDKGIFTLGERMALVVVSSAAILQLKKNEVELEYDPFQLVIAGFIPRFLWEDKPVISRGGWFTSVLDKRSRKNKVTATALTAPGELFWAYGWFGVVIGMLIIGWFVEEAWNMISTHGLGNLAALVLLVYISQESFRWFEAEASAAISLLLLLMIGTTLYAKFFNHSKHQQSRKAV